MTKPIYVIDDDLDIREVIEFALENSGFHVTSFANGESALKALNNSDSDNLPGLIIVDYLMPVMDGATFIHTVQKSTNKNILEIPLALSSAMGTSDPVLSDLKDVIHLPKPMDLEDLLQTAKEHCS